MFVCLSVSYMQEDFRLKVFMAVVKERNFTKAASGLGISQPAVSQNISELEKNLGVKLFERGKNEILLTPEGAVLMDCAGRIRDVYSSVRDMFASLPPAKVRISISEELYSNLFGPSLDSFMKVHPEIEFVRCLFDDADLCIFLRPSYTNGKARQGDSIARLRVSIFSPAAMETGDRIATRELTSYFDVVFQPSESFACTKLCRLLKEFLVP